jgi:hypothetical protein
MLRNLVILIILSSYSQVQGVTIERPRSDHIEERNRTDIDPILRYYVVPREIQFHADALQDVLLFFLKCKGSDNSIQFIAPPTVTEVNTAYVRKSV